MTDRFDPPEIEEDEHEILWRYMDFSKYASILSRGEIWFNLADDLMDPYEGTMPKQVQDPYYEVIREDMGDSTADKVFDIVKKAVRKFPISCWTHKERQSTALWDQYMTGSNGIALKTTASDLKSSLSDSRYNFYFGKVNYIDYKNDSYEFRVPAPVYHKRNSFSHEDEYRVAVKGGPDDEEDIFTDGGYVSIDKSELISEVYIHPMAEPWFENLVNRVTGDYSIDAEVKKSKLYEHPDQ